MPILTSVVLYRYGQLHWCRRSVKSTNIQQVADSLHWVHFAMGGNQMWLKY